jgi:rhomboid protease GluP
LNGNRFHETFPATAFLLLFNLCFFVLELIENLKLAGTFELATLLNVHPSVTTLLGSLSLHGIERGEYWRLISATFLHAGIIHLFFNTMVLGDLGRVCEPLVTSWKFVVVYGASALGGSLASVLSAGHPLRSSVGASGALCGLIGMLLVYSIRERHPEMRKSVVRWILWIAFLTFFIPHIDHAAHIGGFLVGGAFGFTVRDYFHSRAAARWRYPGYAVATAGVVCLGFALWNYFAHR